MKAFRKNPGIVRYVTKKMGHYDLLLTPKRSSSSSVLTIHIEAVVVAINRLPYSVAFMLGNKTKMLEPNVPVDLPKVKPGRSVRAGIKLTFGDQPLISMTISADPDSTTEIPSADDMSLAVDAIRRDDSSQMQLIFYAPVIIFNRSSHLLRISNPAGDLLREFLPREAKSSTTEDGIMILGRRSYFSNSPSLSIRVVVASDAHVTTTNNEQGFSFSDAIECVGPDTHKMLLVPDTSMHDSYVPLHYTVQSARPYCRTTIMTFFSQFKVCNKLSFPITIQPLRNKFDKGALGLPIRIRPGQDHAIMSASSNLCFGVWSETAPFLVPVSFSNNGRRTFFMQTDSKPYFVEVIIEENGLDVSVTFTQATFPQSIMITNLFEDVDIEYSQAPSKVRILVSANSTGIFGWADPCVLTYMTIHMLGSEIGIAGDFQKEKHEVIQGRPVHVYFTRQGYQSQTIVVSPNPPNQSSRSELSIKVHIPIIQFSLIDDKVREFLLFSMRHIQMSFMSNVGLTTLKIFVHSLQLDDLHPQASYKVAMLGDTCDNFHFLEFRCSIYSNAPLFSKFRDISVRVQTVYFFVDIRFLSDMLNFIQPHIKSADKIEPPDPLHTKSVLASVPISMETFVIYRILFTISSRTSTGRPNSWPLWSSTMRFLPNITGFELKLPEHRKAQLESLNSATFQQEIVDMYTTAVREQVTKVLPSIDLLGRKSVSSMARIENRIEEVPIAATPYRVARTMPNRQIVIFDPVWGACQSLIHFGDGKTRKGFPGETIELLFPVKWQKRVFCVTEHYIFEILNQQGTDAQPLCFGMTEKLKYFGKVETVGPDLKLDPGHGKKEIIVTGLDPLAADQVKTYMMSQFRALNSGL
jgi:hypothetical protein